MNKELKRRRRNLQS